MKVNASEAIQSIKVCAITQNRYFYFCIYRVTCTLFQLLSVLFIQIAYSLGKANLVFQVRTGS